MPVAQQFSAEQQAVLGLLEKLSLLLEQEQAVLIERDLERLETVTEEKNRLVSALQPYKPEIFSSTNQTEQSQLVKLLETCLQRNHENHGLVMLGMRQTKQMLSLLSGTADGNVYGHGKQSPFTHSKRELARA
jgi:flagellar biosynthesis/type III secretory pathway chaperone